MSQQNTCGIFYGFWYYRFWKFLHQNYQLFLTKFHLKLRDEFLRNSRKLLQEMFTYSMVQLLKEFWWWGRFEISRTKTFRTAAANFWNNFCSKKICRISNILRVRNGSSICILRLYIKNRSVANAELLEINDGKTLKNHRKPTDFFSILQLCRIWCL